MRGDSRMTAATGGLPPALQSAALRRGTVDHGMSRLHSRQALHMLGWCVAVLLIASALMPLVPRLVAPRVALTLEVSGELTRVSAEAVKRAVAPHLNRDFYELDLATVKAAVEALPWVARARIERIWPAAISVHVREHRAVARWGENSLLAEDDRVFVPDVLTPDLAALPRLEGPDGRESDVRAAFEALATTLRDTPFVPARLSLNLRGEWTAITADGLELRLGRRAPTDAVASLTGPVRTALEGRLQEVTYVDLHYFNGFAVGWREQQRALDDRSPAVVAEGRHE